MKLFWKIFFATFSLLMIMTSLLAYKATKMQLSSSHKYFMNANSTIGDYIANDVEVGYFEQYWPFEALHKLSQHEGFMFWWIVEDNGQIHLADDVEFVHTRAEHYFPDVMDFSGQENLIKNWDKQYAIYIKKIGPEDKSWYFFYGFSLNELVRSEREIIFLTAGLPFIGIILIGFILYFLINYFLRPIEKLVVGTEAVSKGHFDHKLYVQSSDELGKLSKSFNKMTAKLHSSTTSISRLNSEISVRKNSEEEARIAKERAEHAEKAKSMFLANMSHEIRTPINAILGFTNILENREMDNISQEYLGTITSSGKLLQSIVNDILDLSKLESGKIDLERIEFNLYELVEETMRMVVSRIKDDEIDIYVDIDESVPKRVLGDPTRLKQVLMNLLANAEKFTSKGEIGLHVKQSSSQTNSSQANFSQANNNEAICLTFTVHDTGVGISDENLKKIFAPFNQVDASTTRKYGGTGLGLTICKMLTKAMGGSLSVDSKSGIGSDFHFDALFSPAPKLVSEQGQQEQAFGKLTTPDIDYTVLRVGIIENKTATRKQLEKHCRKVGMELVYSTATWSEFWLAFEQHKHTPLDIMFCNIPKDQLQLKVLAKKLDVSTEDKRPKLISISNTFPKYNSPLFNTSLLKPVTRTTLTNAVARVFPITQRPTQKTANLPKFDSKINVLVVEDNIPNQMIMQAYLERLNCTCYIAENGLEAINILRDKSDFDICLMDMQMPVMDGIEATRRIRAEISRELPIIIVSATVFEENLEQARQAGTNGFISKPVSVDSLYARIRESIKRETEDLEC